MKILLLGVGRWGHNHLRVLRSLPVDVFIVDTDEKVLQHCRDMGVMPARIAGDHRVFLDKIDAAVIATPAQTHAVLCEDLLSARKDVFIEKPMTVSSAQALKLTSLAASAQRILQVGHIFRYDPASQWIHEAIQSGKFGRIKIMRGIFQGFKRPRQDTGVAFADALHFIDLFNHWTGGLPHSVTAVMKDLMDRGMEDECFISLDYEHAQGPIWAKIEAGYHIPGKNRIVEIVGEDLSARCDFSASPSQIILYENKHKKNGDGVVAVEGPSQVLTMSSCEPLVEELKAFIHSIATRQPPMAGGKEGVEALMVLEAAAESARSATKIALDSSGGRKVTSEGIALSRCFVNEEIRRSVADVIDSGQYILGRECDVFERELAAHTGVKQAVLCSSATMALLMVHQALDVKEGDEVIVPSLTAFPTIEGLVHRGAKPVFVDVDETMGLDVRKVEAAITPRTVGILPVHLYGHPVDMDPLLDIAQKYHLWVIEDCAQAQGASYKSKKVGALGRAGVFSFFPSKNLTVLGDGGCVCTDDEGLADKVRMLRNHGRREKYVHEKFGYNLRFNEIQAAAGRVGLRHLDRLNARRRAIAARYQKQLSGMVITPLERSWAEAVYHMYVIRTKDRDGLMDYLSKHKISTGIHYPAAVHQQPAMKGYGAGDLSATEKAVKEILSLPIHGEMSDEDVDLVCHQIKRYFKRS